MRFEVPVDTTRPTQELDVALPAFALHDMTDEREHRILTRFSAHPRGGFERVALRITENAVEVEVQHHVGWDVRNANYFLGLGEYASSRQEFEEAAKRLHSLLDEVGISLPPALPKIDDAMRARALAALHAATEHRSTKRDPRAAVEAILIAALNP